jgi:hypothetical protein
MEAYEFVSKVREMRKVQKAYFKNRLQSDLIQSKQLEKEVDQALEAGVVLWTVGYDPGVDVPPHKDWKERNNEQ